MRRSLKLKATNSGAFPGALPKCPAGIQGLDEVTLGGLPRARTTLVCGSAGCGKTLLGMVFLVRGTTRFDGPGVCLSFAESAEELACNVASLGFDVGTLIARKKLVIDQERILVGRVSRAAALDDAVAQEELKPKQWERDRSEMAQSRSVNSGLQDGVGGKARGRR